MNVLGTDVWIFKACLAWLCSVLNMTLNFVLYTLNYKYLAFDNVHCTFVLTLVVTVSLHYCILHYTVFMLKSHLPSTLYWLHLAAFKIVSLPHLLLFGG